MFDPFAHQVQRSMPTLPNQSHTTLSQPIEDWQKKLQNPPPVPFLPYQLERHSTVRSRCSCDIAIRAIRTALDTYDYVFKSNKFKWKVCVAKPGQRTLRLIIRLFSCTGDTNRTVIETQCRRGDQFVFQDWFAGFHDMLYKQGVVSTLPTRPYRLFGMPVPTLLTENSGLISMVVDTNWDAQIEGLRYLTLALDIPENIHLLESIDGFKSHLINNLCEHKPDSELCRFSAEVLLRLDTTNYEQEISVFLKKVSAKGLMWTPAKQACLRILSK